MPARRVQTGKELKMACPLDRGIRESSSKWRAASAQNSPPKLADCVPQLFTGHGGPEICKLPA